MHRPARRCCNCGFGGTLPTLSGHRALAHQHNSRTTGKNGCGNLWGPRRWAVLEKDGRKGGVPGPARHSVKQEPRWEGYPRSTRNCVTMSSKCSFDCWSHSLATRFPNEGIVGGVCANQCDRAVSTGVAESLNSFSCPRPRE